MLLPAELWYLWLHSSQPTLGEMDTFTKALTVTDFFFLSVLDQIYLKSPIPQG